MATFTTAAAVSRSCFANSPLGWEAIQDDRTILWNTPLPWRRPFPARVLTFGRIPFLLTFLRPTSGCCQEGKSALTLLCRILLLPPRQDSTPFKSTLVWHLVPVTTTHFRRLSPPYYSWRRGREDGGREAQPPLKLLLIRSTENFLATLQCLSSCHILSDGHFFQASCQDFVTISEPDGRQSRRRP